MAKLLLALAFSSIWDAIADRPVNYLIQHNCHNSSGKRDFCLLISASTA
jgi:hypothetical protein